MIKKLRIRFIIINMALVSIVLLGIFLANSISTYNQITSNSYSNLNESRKNIDTFNRDANPDERKKNPSSGGFSQEVLWVCITDEDIEVLNTDPTDYYSDEYVTTIVEAATAKDKAQGLLKEYDLRYSYQKTPDGEQLIGFIDVSYEQSFFYKQVINYMLIGIVSLAVFFVISYFLSKIAIKPVAKTFKQQQQFISDVSHELKTPITVILANASIMKTEETKTKSKWLDYIEKEAKRMKKLVDELLFLARLDEADKLQIQTKLNLSDTLFSCVLPFEPVAFENGISIDNNIDDDIFIKGNIDQIKRLILILVDNACKYGKKSSKINVRLKSTNGKAKLSIHNEGSTIPQDDIDKIFDRFYRVDKARERKKNSYGLGLSMAKKIVDAHNGDISVKSNEQDGTTFYISLPQINKK